MKEARSLVKALIENSPKLTTLDLINGSFNNEEIDEVNKLIFLKMLEVSTLSGEELEFPEFEVD